MPLDPSLIYGIRQPEVQPYGAAAARTMQLRNMHLQGQQEEQQIRAGAMRLDAAAREKAENEAFNALIQENTTPDGKTDFMRVGTAMTQRGYGAKGASIIDGARASQLALQKQQTADAKAKHTELSQMLYAVKNAPPEQKQALHAAMKQRAVARGLAKPEEIPDQFDPAFLDISLAEDLELKTQIAAAEKAIELAEKQRAAKEDEAHKTATLKETVRNDDLLHADRTRGQDKTAETAANALKQTTKYQDGMLGVARQNANTNRAEYEFRREQARGANPTGSTATGDAFLATLPPSMAATVKAVAEGRQTQLPRDKSFGPLMAAVNQYDPTYTAQRAKLRGAFTTGPDGRNIGALNTAVDHLDQLHEAAKAMNNGTWQPGNKLYNYVAEKFGADAPTNYAYVMNALAGETASALKGNATDPEIAHVMQTLSPDMSPKQAAGVAIAGLHVMGAKLNTYDERFKSQVPNDPWSPVLPTARAVFERYKINPTAGPKHAQPGAPAQSGGGTVISLADVKHTAEKSGKSVEQVMKDARAKGYVIR